MRQRMEAQERKRYAGSVKFIVLAAVVVFSAVMIALKVDELGAMQAKHAQLVQQEKTLSEQLEELENQENYIESDAYAEKIAREKFGWVKDGEILFKRTENGQVVSEGDGF